MSVPVNIVELGVVCSDYAALAGGATAFWVEDLSGVVVAQSGGLRRGRTARSALMRRQKVRYAACALGPSANAMVPFFARACQRELDHALAWESDAGRVPAGTVLGDESALDVAGLVHDLNNLLGTITGNAELLEAAVVDSARGREQAVRILRSCRLARLLVARLRNADRHGDRSKVDLSAAVDDVIELTGARANANVSIVCECQPQGCVIEADALAIEQLLLNLVVNALAALSENGHLEISLSTQASADCDAADVILRVRDDGCGMDAETLARVSNFGRVVGTDGGVGLLLVSRIVANHRGRVEIVSMPGRGTQVEIVLPAEARDSSMGAGVDGRSIGGEGLHG